ncbi:MAG: aspartyl protease family protein [Thermoanaerobaculia bacterium]
MYAALVLLAACTFSRETAVYPHELLPPAAPDPVSAFNVEEKLQRGMVPEVVAYLTGPGGRSMAPETAARILAQAKLESGDFPSAELLAERVLARTPRISLRAEMEWLRSQSAYWRDDFGAAARWAAAAREAGRGVPEGWITFLLSGEARTLYGGATSGQHLLLHFRLGRPNLIRIEVEVNDRATKDVILDSGASLSLLTESAARRLGVEMVEGAVAPARGLHDKEIPMHFGWARSVTLGGLTLRDVPFGILPDGTLSFETASLGVFTPEGVIGIHFMKDFDWRIEPSDRRLQAVRLPSGVPRGGPDQNLFFRRMKPMVRASFNRRPWSLFLLDTGSEPTMVTPEGLRANQYTSTKPSAPVTLEGIGKAEVSWSKVSNITVGISRYMVWFKDLVVNEGSEVIGDGIIGMSYLSAFDMELRFSRMTLVLGRPGDRRSAPRSLFEQEPGVLPPG